MNSSLYKYFPARPGFFENYLIRSTTRLSLNDPFEVNPSIDFFVGFCLHFNETRFGKTEDEIREYLISLPKNSNSRELGITWYKNHGIVSLTETKDNLLMWSHYASEHSGYVVEFDTNHDFFNEKFISDSNSHSGKVTRVLYRKERLSDLGAFAMEPYFHKSDEWAYEKEHRLLLPVDSADERWIDTESLNQLIKSGSLGKVDSIPLNDKLSVLQSCQYMGSLIFHPEVMFMFEVPKEAIKSVTFGVNTKEELKADIIRKITNQNLNITVYEAQLDEFYYRLKFEEKI